MKGAAPAVRLDVSIRRQEMIMSWYELKSWWDEEFDRIIVIAAIAFLISLFLALVFFGKPSHAQDPTLTVSTSDGLVSFRGVNQLIFPPGSVRVNGKAATITTGGGSSVPGSGIAR